MTKPRAWILLILIAIWLLGACRPDLGAPASTPTLPNLGEPVVNITSVPDVRAAAEAFWRRGRLRIMLACTRCSPALVRMP